MEVSLRNCNNISSATILVEENRLNIKYAINGTGKSTVSKAIEYGVANNAEGLTSLTPYQYIGDDNPNHAPSINGLPGDIRLAVFDESYVEQYVFLEDELVKNSFEIFVKTANYDQRITEINRITPINSTSNLGIPGLQYLELNPI